MKFLIPLLLVASLLTDQFAVGDVVVDTPAAPMEYNLSAPAAELVKLSDSNVEESVILAYVNNSTSSFNLSAADIIYLRDLGFSPEVITAVMNHDKLLREKGTNITQSVAPVQSLPSAEPSNQIYNAPVPVPSELPPDAQRFFQDLAPFGTWVNSGEFGWGWQPTAALLNRDWRPYSDNGRWLWTDRGWYWASDYSWGDITFHYGRWLLTNDWGWLWFPDTVWAPAWVTWRVYDSYCGWAPLPPATFFDTEFRFRYREQVVWSGCDFDLSPHCFTFVPWRHCVERNPRLHCVPTVQVNQFFNRTVVVNNLKQHNNVVINRGVDVKHVTAATGKQMAPIPVVMATSPGRRSNVPHVRNGNPVAALQKPLPVAPKPGAPPTLPMVTRQTTPQPVGAPTSPDLKHGGSSTPVKHSSRPATKPSFTPIPSPSPSQKAPVLAQQKPVPHSSQETVKLNPNWNAPKVVSVQKTPGSEAVIKPQSVKPPVTAPVLPVPESKPPVLNSHFSPPASANAIQSKNVVISAGAAPAIPTPSASATPRYVPPVVSQSPSFTPRLNQAERLAQFNASPAQVVQAPPRVTPPVSSHAAPAAAGKASPHSAVAAAGNERDQSGKGRNRK